MKMKGDGGSSATFSYKGSRSYLTGLFLSKVKKNKFTLAAIRRTSGVSRGTLCHIMHGYIPNLATLCQLFRAPFPVPWLTPEEACLAVMGIISDSLIDSPSPPIFRLASSADEYPFPDPLPSLSAYMKQFRECHLRISVREACLRFEHCDTLQMSRIENDCCRVGLGPVCYLFNSYLTAIPTLNDKEWGVFATLLLHQLFPFLSAHRLLFTGVFLIER
jgi:hypothetical protein